MNGGLVFRRHSTFAAGENTINVTSTDVGYPGVFLYELKFEDQIHNGKMIRIE